MSQNDDFNQKLKSLVRSLPDVPEPGVVFRDITTLLKDAEGFGKTVDEMVNFYPKEEIDKVAAIDARGFILGGAIAHQLSTGFIPLRKQGKLPWHTIGRDYSLEYGGDRLEIHTDSVAKGERVLLVDDLLATGGTATAAIQLLEETGAKITGCCFVINLPNLGGSELIRRLGHKVKTVIEFE